MIRKKIFQVSNLTYKIITFSQRIHITSCCTPLGCVLDVALVVVRGCCGTVVFVLYSSAT